MRTERDTYIGFGALAFAESTGKISYRFLLGHKRVASLYNPYRRFSLIPYSETVGTIFLVMSFSGNAQLRCHCKPLFLTIPPNNQGCLPSN